MSGYNAKVYHKQGGDALVVDVLNGGKIETPSGQDLGVGKHYQTLDIADGSAEASYYVVAQRAGKITKFRSIIDGAVSTADITLTPSINGVAVTDGVVTIATAASGAGDVDSATPSGANTVAVGDKISFVVTGGGAGGSPRIHVDIEISAQ